MLYNSVNLIYLLSALLYPIMPSTTHAILRQLGNAPLRRLQDWRTVRWMGEDLDAGTKLGKAEYLFERIDEKMEKVFSDKFGGGQQPAAKKTEPVLVAGDAETAARETS